MFYTIVFIWFADCHNTTNNKNNHVLDNSSKCKPENVEYHLWVALLSVCDIGMAHAGNQIWKSLFPLLQSMEHPMDVWSPKNMYLCKVFMTLFICGYHIG